MIKNYNEIVSACRDLARDYLRLEMINDTRNTLLEQEKCCDKKHLARLEYQLSILDSNNPDFESEKKEIEQRIAVENTNLEKCAKFRVDLENKIAKIESGEIKVSAEALADRTIKLLKVYIKNKVAELK